MNEINLDELLSRHSAEVVDTFRALRALACDVAPDATEQLDLPDHLLAFGFGPGGGIRPSNFAVGLIPHTGHVNLQLADGALLADPAGIVEGTGKRIRHVKCRSVEDVGRPALRAVIEEQVERRQR